MQMLSPGSQSSNQVTGFVHQQDRSPSSTSNYSITEFSSTTTTPQLAPDSQTITASQGFHQQKDNNPINEQKLTKRDQSEKLQQSLQIGDKSNTEISQRAKFYSTGLGSQKLHMRMDELQQNLIGNTQFPKQNTNYQVLSPEILQLQQLQLAAQQIGFPDHKYQTYLHKILKIDDPQHRVSMTEELLQEMQSFQAFQNQQQLLLLQLQQQQLKQNRLGYAQVHGNDQFEYQQQLVDIPFQNAQPFMMSQKHQVERIDPFIPFEQNQQALITVASMPNFTQNIISLNSQPQHGMGNFSRRDSSISSSISSSSHASSASSKGRSSQHSNAKYLIAQAIHKFNLLQTEPERRLHLIENASLFAKDKTGCQLLQNKITEEITLQAEQKTATPSQFVEDVLQELLFQDSMFYKLMMHPMANFLCQMLFRQGSRTQIEKVLETIKSKFYRIAQDPSGTRALQVLLDECIQRGKTTKKTSKLIVEGLEKGRVFELVCNIRGNHVVKKCLRLIGSEARYKVIFTPVLQHFQQIARDQHGCQVVQECILLANADQRMEIITAAQVSIQQLINDEYGNFVVQNILDFRSKSVQQTKDKAQRQVTAPDHMNIQHSRQVQGFYDYIIQNMSQLCKQQFSSRVVETALRNMQRENLEKVFVVFVDKRNSTKKNKLFRELMLDNYGNYIAPKLIERVKCASLQKYYDYFIKIFYESLDAIKKVKHGRQLINKINEIIDAGQQQKPHSQAINKTQTPQQPQQKSNISQIQTQQTQPQSGPSLGNSTSCSQKSNYSRC